MKNYIILSVLILFASCAPEQSTCSDFHEGKFGYTDPAHDHIEITRTANAQIEINTKTKIEAHTSIKWVSDCKYVLTYEKFENAPKEFESLIGQKITSEITEIGKDKFTCSVKSKNSNELMEFKVIK